MPSIIDSYLVSLGAVVDGSAFQRFHYTLRDAERQVFSFTGSTGLTFVKMEATVVGAISAIGMGMIALADKVATTDQQYRLFGMRMLLTKDVARTVSMALDTLHATLDEVTFDPELNRRFTFLTEYYKELGKGLGPDFDKTMQQIRDVQMYWGILKKELEFGVMAFVGNLARKMGIEDLSEKLLKIDNWVKDNLPHWADIASDALVPAFKDFQLIWVDLKDVMKDAGEIFVRFTGFLLGDNSLKDTNLSMESLSRATRDWIDTLAEGALTIQLFAKTGLHMFESLMDALRAYSALWSGHKAESDKLAAKSQQEFEMGWNNIKDYFSGKGGYGQGGTANPDMQHLNEFLNKSILYGHQETSKTSDTPQYIRGAEVIGPYERRPGSKATANDLTIATMKSLAEKVGSDMGLPANLILDQWAEETGGFTSYGATHRRNLGGLMIPGTQTQRSFGSFEEFAGAYEQFIGTKRHLPGLKGAKTPHDWAYSLSASGYYPESAANYAAGMERFQRQYYGDDGGGTVNIDSVTINVPHDLPKESWAPFIKKSMTNLLDKNNANITAGTAGGPFH